MDKKNIAIVGLGYVGYSLSVLLARKHNVCSVDIDKQKVDAVNAGKCLFRDEYAQKLVSEGLTFKATTSLEEACKNAEFVLVATPTNYDDEKQFFDTTAVDSVIADVLKINPDACIVVKSTVPVGYTAGICKKHNVENVIFSPEFLRENNAVYDNLHPSRIIVGANLENEAAKNFANIFADVLLDAADDKDVQTLIMSSTEAEAVKLFANTFLALRVSFFNELDTYADEKNLNTKNLIAGVCADSRVGDYYNNPSFGYGGYCLPKDSKQLLANFKDVPQSMISAIVESNTTRKDYIAQRIVSSLPKDAGDECIVGIYKLAMKAMSDNFRNSSVQGIIDRLKKAGCKLLIYEPLLGDSKDFVGCEVDNDFASFEKRCSIIVANRVDSQLDSCIDKVYSRDIFHLD